MSVLHSEAGPSNWHQQQQQQQPPSQHHHHQSIQPLRTDPLRHQPLIPSASPYASSSSPQNGHVQPNSDRRSGGEERNGSSSVRKVDGSSWGVLPPDAPRSYTPVKLVGDGSFGTVWLCDWHSPLPRGTTLSPMQCGAGARPEWAGKRLVAVKRMKRVWERGWEEAGKLKELESLRSIPSHPNIIPLYDAFLQPSKELYFVFECMEGNLYQLTKSRKGRPLAGGLIASIFHQVISGLEHVHRSGYFHRDMKPENLLVTTIGLQDYTPVKEENREAGDGAGGGGRGGKPAGRMETDVVVIVKLADFGLAREIESKPPYTEYVSTRWYRAPEVLLRSRDYGPAVDMWALGTILAELVNLKPLFPGQSEVDQVYKICAILGDPSREYGLDGRGKLRGGGDWDRGIKMARAVGFGFPKMAPIPFASLFDSSTPLTLIDVISECIRYNPKHRITSKACLSHAYFTETVPKIQTAPYIPPMPEAPSQSTLISRPTQPHLSSTASTTALISPPDSVQSVAPRDLPPSHSNHQQVAYAQPKPCFNVGDSCRTLPLPQPSNPAANRVPFYPQYREAHSQSPGLPTSPEASSHSLHSSHSQKTVYDVPSLEHSLSSGSTLVHGGGRDRSSGASALVDRLRELDLPAADLSSYGRRAPPTNVRGNDYSPLSIPHWQQHAQQYQTQSTTSLPPMNDSQPHIPSLENYGQPNFNSPAYDQSTSSIATRSTHPSSAYIDTPSPAVDPSYRPPQLHRTPYDNDRSMPPLPLKVDEPVRRQDVVMANAQVEANKRALAAPQKKKKWGLGSVFGSSLHSNDSKYSHHHEHLASVGEESVSSSASVPLKRSQSVSSNGGLDPGGGGNRAPPLDPKAAAKEAKRAAKQLELARREAASAAAKERARAVMQKRDRLVNEQVGKGGSLSSGTGSVSASEGKDKGKTTSQTSLERVNNGASSSQGSFTSTRSAGTNASLLSSHQAQEQHARNHQHSPSTSSLQKSHHHQPTSSSNLRALGGSSSTPTLNSSGSSSTSFRNDPLALAQSQRHKSRRRDGDDDHSTSSYNPSRSSFRSPSIMTFASIDSDPGPKPSSRLYPSSLGINRSTSSSNANVVTAHLPHHHASHHASSPQLYSLPHGSGVIENQLARDFREHTKLASSSNSSLGYGGGGDGWQPHSLYGGRTTSQTSRMNLMHPSERGSGENSPSPSEGYVNPMFQVVDPSTHSNSNTSGTTLPPFSHIASVADRNQYNHHPHRSPSGS